ncbi:MAG: glycosyltransferase family 39 protein [Patescibacteria group bacterium]
MKKHYFLLALILFATFIFRFPSLFEPFWYGDEGIFAAVGRNLNFGGVLYQDAWDNKPPMIYLSYQLIFNFFGVSMFWLRLAAAIVVMATAVVIYEIAREAYGKKRALVATLAFGFLTSLRLVEGNLALTEIFMILPISMAMMIAILKKFDYPSLFAAGILLAIGSLYKQVGVLEAAALGIFLFFYIQKFAEFLRRGLVLTSGFTVPFLIFIAYFAPKNLVGEYIFAAYTYYQIYLGESPRYALLINALKFAPIVAAVIYGIWKKTKGKLSIFHLFLLWTAFSFLGSYFSSRTYGHYLVQAIPAVSLLLASLNLRPIITRTRLKFGISFFVPLVFLTKLLFTDFLTGGPLNQIKYWGNFWEFASGKIGTDQYNDFFDRNVNSVMAARDFLAARGAMGSWTYIWGDLPWLYAVADLKNPSRYVTSFHVFGVPNGRDEVIGDLVENPPDYIIKPPSSIGYFAELEKLIAEGYTLRSKVEDVAIFVKRGE